MTGTAAAEDVDELKRKVMQLELMYANVLEKLNTVIEKQDQAHDEARDFRHRMANSQQGTDTRIARVEAVICPDPITGQKSMGQRVAAIETAVLTANISWKTMAKIGGVVVLCAGGMSWLLDKVLTFFGGAPPHH